MTRDFIGYGRQLPQAAWPNKARLAISFVINFEEGAETTISSGDPRNEGVYEVIDEVVGVADRCIESHFEYGTKAGYWRIVDMFEQFGMPATVSACGLAAQVSPWLVEDAFQRGHEIAAHGWRWEKHAHIAEAEERTAIRQSIKAIESITGTRPVGWHTRSTPSPNTRRLLAEQGFLYDSDDYSDDLPFFAPGMKNYLVVPYAFDTNDMHFNFGFQRYVGADDFANYVIESIDRLWQEGQSAPRMITVGLHLRILGRPGRIGALERIFQHIESRGEVWVARRDEIARHWISQFAEHTG